MAESEFFDQQLLQTEYCRSYRCGYDDTRFGPFSNPHRNYRVLLEDLTEIFSFKPEHAFSYTTRIKSQDKDWKSCEAVFSEIIVYHFYLKLYHEGLVTSLDLCKDEFDLSVERPDGNRMYLEVFCVMPDVKVSTPDNPIVNEIKTHTQDAMSSIRQKLLQKIEKQNQFTQPRENYAVIELNDPRIADDFTILSSLSSGYKVSVNPSTTKVLGEGYDWNNSLFEDPRAIHLKAVIYFGVGAYHQRRIIYNPNFVLKGVGST